MRIKRPWRTVMATSNDAELQGRVLVLAPTARDADVTQSFLLKAGLACVVVPDLRTLGEELDKGAGATLLTDDVATAEATAEMLAVLRRQPTWSQPPFVVLMRGGAQSAVADALLRALGNVTVLDRPASMRTLASAVQSAVRGRLRQYQIRDQIEEIRRGEEAVRQSEARFRQLADSIPQLAWMAHPDGFIYWYNRRWYEYTGTTPGQMEGWGWQSVHHPTHLPRVMDQWKRAIATGTLFEMEFPLRAADGTFGWFLTRVVPLHDDAGRTVMWFGTNTDVTGQRRTADALRESEQRLRLAVHTARLRPVGPGPAHRHPDLLRRVQGRFRPRPRRPVHLRRLLAGGPPRGRPPRPRRDSTSHRKPRRIRDRMPQRLARRVDPLADRPRATPSTPPAGRRWPSAASRSTSPTASGSSGSGRRCSRASAPPAPRPSAPAG